MKVKVTRVVILLNSRAPSFISIYGNSNKRPALTTEFE